MRGLKQIEVVCAACIIDGKVLIAKRRDQNAWEFPGGKVEAGETYEEAAIREFQEECSVTIESLTPLMVSTDVQNDTLITLHSFACTASKKPDTPVVHEEFVWTEPEHIYDWAFFEADRDLVEELKRRWKDLSQLKSQK